ncbi:hypothetical protein [Schinkia azotoformans]|uniref:hypothetical protein n=2 Tax=Schinkia azotoformans TaxID=1454 RepID=UPI002DB6E548|nr:hypothetical protein [Schinkia azotoformans]MEC1739823.1 hypothetical protein [Schinkia azotoformans]MEC1765052.1 hypothetical protein [Schinkia azotoformans]MEC1788565.1 hypothetical protein [Schinkia azotoformans]MED4365784.1 hypothetical protein [Schinkia azotoformans]MED4375400.1 hypothetical protein [Schinkia azotoformans]
MTKQNLLNGGIVMWVIVAYSKSGITMYEFDSEQEAREKLREIQGCKILSEIAYFNDKNQKCLVI